VDQAIRLALDHGVMLCTYGDCLRVPASDGLSLLKARARGADVRMVYSSADAVALARQHPDRQVVFFAIGFETTTPPTAVAIREAAALGLGNFGAVLPCADPAGHDRHPGSARQCGAFPSTVSSARPTCPPSSAARPTPSAPSATANRW
jgi:hypothetical protein